VEFRVLGSKAGQKRGGNGGKKVTFLGVFFSLFGGLKRGRWKRSKFGVFFPGFEILISIF